MSEGRPKWTLQDAEAAAAGTVLRTSWLARCRIRVFDAILFPYFWVANLFRRAEAGRSDDEVRKILVVEYANFGDIVLLLPFLQNLRTHYPLAQITLLANPKTNSLLEGLNLVDEIIPIHVPQGMYLSRRQRFNFFSPLWFNSWRRLRQLRRRKFDLALTARIDVLDNWMLWMTGAARRLGYALHGGRFFLTDVVKPDLDHVHGADRWLAILHALRKPVLERLPRLRTLPGEYQNFRYHHKCNRTARWRHARLYEFAEAVAGGGDFRDCACAWSDYSCERSWPCFRDASYSFVTIADRCTLLRPWVCLSLRCSAQRRRSGSGHWEPVTDW